MSEIDTYTARGWAGWPEAVTSYKISVEAALAEQGVGFWIIPSVGKPPTNLAGMGVHLPGFAYAAPDGFIAPAPIESIWPMSTSTALALQTVLLGTTE